MAINHCRNVTDLFLNVAADHARSVALSYKSRQFHYSELAQMVHRISQGLAGVGVRPAETVGLAIHRSPQLVAAVLGVLLEDATILPLDPDYPQDRLRFMATDAKPSVILVDDQVPVSLRSTLEDCARVVSVESLMSGVAKHSAGATGSRGPHSPAAYMLYTSGSTGTPKGVRGTHESIWNRVNYMTIRVPFSGSDVFCAKTSLNFVDAIWDIFQPLLTGLPLAIYPQTSGLSRANQDEFLRFLKEERVSRLSIVPSHLRALLDYSPDLRAYLPALNILDVTGEPFPAALAGQALGRLPGVRIFNRYGTTEAPSTFFYEIVSTPPDVRGGVSLGFPIENTDVYILDEELRRVSQGQTGELCIGGSQVALGYHRLDRLTQERFLAASLVGGKSGCVYRTGDMAQEEADGSITYLGRKDYQVSVRGTRIELAEIEMALEGTGLVSAAAARKEPGDHGPLVAFCVPANSAIDTKELRQRLAAFLPREAIPSIFVERADLPRLPNGKVDRIAIADLPAEVAASAGRTGRSTGGPMHAMVAALLGQLIGRADIEADENILSAGLDSLAAIELVTKLTVITGRTVNVSTVYEQPTISSLGTMLETLIESKVPSSASIGCRVTAQETAAIVSSQQLLLWRLDNHMETSKGVYNELWPLWLTGKIDAGALALAIDQLIQDHPAFRTKLYEHDGAVYQEVLPPYSAKLTEEFASWNSPEEESVELRKVVQAELDRRFELQSGHLLRARLIQVTQGRRLLILCCHHAASDGWSEVLINSSLSQSYRAIVDRLPISVRSKRATYADFLTWQKEMLSSGAWHHQLAYWANQLSGLDWSNAQLNIGSYSSSPGFDPESFSVDLPREKLLSVLEHSKSLGISRFVCLLTVAFWAIHMVTKETSVVIGSPVAYRHHPGLREVIGFFPNMLLYRYDIGDDVTLSQAFRTVHSTVVAAFSNQDVPVSVLADRLGAWRGARHPFVGAVMVVDDGTLIKTGETINISAAQCELATELMPVPYPKFDFRLVVNIRPDRCYVNCLYDKSVVRSSYANSVVCSFCDLIDRCETIDSATSISIQSMQGS
jgi:amino acid adenylation domain-containing protein